MRDTTWKQALLKARFMRRCGVATGVRILARRILDAAANGEVVCDGCGQTTDPTCCWCGTDREQHNDCGDNHHFVAFGCECLRLSWT